MTRNRPRRRTVAAGVRPGGRDTRWDLPHSRGRCSRRLTSRFIRSLTTMPPGSATGSPAGNISGDTRRDGEPMGTTGRVNRGPDAYVAWRKRWPRSRRSPRSAAARRRPCTRRADGAAGAERGARPAAPTTGPDDDRPPDVDGRRTDRPPPPRRAGRHAGARRRAVLWSPGDRGGTSANSRPGCARSPGSSHGPTGTYDALTVAAVKGFQGKRGLPPPGGPDTVTWQRLLAMTHEAGRAGSCTCTAGQPAAEARPALPDRAGCCASARPAAPCAG